MGEFYSELSQSYSILKLLLYFSGGREREQEGERNVSLETWSDLLMVSHNQ